MNNLEQTQKALEKYFSDIDDELFIEFVDSFCYQLPTKNIKVSKLAEKFIEDNGLFDALANEKYDRDREKNGENIIFFRSSLSDRDILENIKIALISISHNKHRKLRSLYNAQKDLSESRHKLISIMKEEINLVDKENKIHFNFLKDLSSTILARLNDGEIFFFSKEEDMGVRNKINNLEFYSINYKK